MVRARRGGRGTQRGHVHEQAVRGLCAAGVWGLPTQGVKRQGREDPWSLPLRLGGPCPDWVPPGTSELPQPEKALRQDVADAWSREPWPCTERGVTRGGGFWPGSFSPPRYGGGRPW